ncbi:hypothetical protein [Oricola sp.]|nr:hypothetical protein [Oricola sp.]MCI5075605.1 hypothetical protein [Oricola sp.]
MAEARLDHGSSGRHAITGRGHRLSATLSHQAEIVALQDYKFLMMHFARA